MHNIATFLTDIEFFLAGALAGAAAVYILHRRVANELALLKATVQHELQVLEHRAETVPHDVLKAVIRSVSARLRNLL